MVKQLWVVTVAAAIAGCNSGSSTSSSSSSSTGSSASPTMPAATPPAAGGITCDEERIQKWIALRKEQGQTLGTGLQDTAKRVEANGSAAALGGLAATGQQLEALQKKYGFERPELNKWNSLASDVMSAHPLDNPMMKGIVDSMRKMQQAGGTQKDSADKFFAEQDASAKKAEARARQKFGDQCVDLAWKHSQEIIDVQLAEAAAVLGTPKH